MCNPILITGAHRSGTTWVGKMIDVSPSVRYIHEPFNIDYSPLKIKPDCWFQYVTRENEGLLYEQIKQLVMPKTFSGRIKRTKERFEFFKASPKKQRALIKDPIAIFSVEWLASRFNMDVVILIRHPAAFVDSIQERNWPHDFNHFLRQPLLMEDHLKPFKDEIVDYANRKYDIFDQAILLWKLIYYMVSKYQNKYDDWFYIKHEDLSLDPEKGFKEIFKYLNIKFTAAIKRTIDDHSNQTNPTDGDVHSIKRNSKAIVKNWKNKLTQKEIEKIRVKVEPISKKFYSDEDW